jgi:hypothetical protein
MWLFRPCRNACIVPRAMESCFVAQVGAVFSCWLRIGFPLLPWNSRPVVLPPRYVFNIRSVVESRYTSRLRFRLVSTSTPWKTDHCTRISPRAKLMSSRVGRRLHSNEDQAAGPIYRQSLLAQPVDATASAINHFSKVCHFGSRHRHCTAAMQRTDMWHGWRDSTAP